MRDAAPEDGLAGIILVEMHRVHVAGGLAEQLDVALGDGLAMLADMPGLSSSR